MGKKGQTVAQSDPAEFAPEANPQGDIPTARDGAVNATDADLPKDANGNVRVEKEKESKRSKFLRLAPRRMGAALKRIGHVANLANRAQYESSDEERARIVKDIEDACAALKRAYSGTKVRASGWSF